MRRPKSLRQRLLESYNPTHGRALLDLIEQGRGTRGAVGRFGPAVTREQYEAAVWRTTPPQNVRGDKG